MAFCKRERIISLRGPVGGGVVATRTLVWPGGDLWLNTAAVPGQESDSNVSVRISDLNRKVRDGFDHGDSQLGGEDPTRQIVNWGDGRSLSEMEGETIRIEIYLQDADLFSLGASKE